MENVHVEVKRRYLGQPQTDRDNVIIEIFEIMLYPDKKDRFKILEFCLDSCCSARTMRTFQNRRRDIVHSVFS